MTNDAWIRLRGVRTHNLRSVDVDIPRNRLTVITGVSGSGKSSLAFDTLYAEGRRRYVECLSTYLQQFLERMARPALDLASGLPPAVAIERARPAVQARSTVGTTTEIADYLQLLFARIGRSHCSRCGRAVIVESPGLVAEELLRRGGRAIVTFVIDGPSSAAGWDALRRELERDGFTRVVRDGAAIALAEAASAPGEVEVVADRVTLEPARRARIAEAVETAYRFGRDRCSVRLADGSRLRFSARLHCADCDLELRRPEPRLFSPNSPLGACPACQGFGRSIEPDLDRIVPDRRRTLAEGAIDPWNKPAYRQSYDDLRAAGRRLGLRWDVPYGELPAAQRRLVEEGGGGFYGVRGFFEWLEGRTYKVHVRVFLARYRAYRPCTVCGGARLRPEALAVRVDGASIADVTSWPVGRTLAWMRGLALGEQERSVGAPVLRELQQRLSFLVDVGLDYLTLDRASRTLSGGEAQRIQLARSLGSSLVDTLYVLDEPSVGLHPQDVERLVDVVCRLRDAGNTVVVVEHDPRVMERADWLVDLGPGAGEAGGRVLYQGPVNGVTKIAESATARYLERRDAIPSARRDRSELGDGWIELTGACTHNLQDVSVRIPLGALTVVTGVSGSGKSSLIHDTLHGALERAISGSAIETGPYRTLTGHEALAGVELVDQSPIGRTPRSNPVTYVKAFDGIRRRLAATPEARARGFAAGFFSFNVPGGRCEACEGAGAVLVEMHFLPDVLVPCEACGGARFGPLALGILDRGRNVAQILELTVRQAREVYRDVPDLARRLAVLDEVGLGYLRLGQPAPTLSGGEAQRLKLAAHLGVRGSGARLFLLDEPTTGLHLQDIEVLVRLLDRLVAAGHTVVVIEHNPELVAAADWIVTLGPGAGPAGGRVVAMGPPGAAASARLPAPARASRERGPG